MHHIRKRKCFVSPIPFANQGAWNGLECRGTGPQNLYLKGQVTNNSPHGLYKVN